MGILNLNFILSFVIASLFVVIFRKPLKKHPEVFYAIALVLAIATLIVGWMGLVPKGSPYLVNKLWQGFRKAVIPTVWFFFVMFAGVLPQQWKVTKALMSVRGELSVMAVIMTLGHNLIYLFAPGYAFFAKTFLTQEIDWNRGAALIVTLLLMALMIPLAITSLRGVRRSMSQAKWQRIQRLAYPFYGLLYVHLMLLYVPKYINKGRGLNEAILYTVIYLVYVILLIRRSIKRRKQEAI